MSRNLLRSSITTVLVLVALIAGSSLAKADDPLWIYARCTQGELLRASDGGQDNVVVFGSSSFCLLHVLNSSFGVAVFETGATTTSVLSYNLRKYNLVGKRDFGMEVARGRSGTFGVCLVGSPTMKVACAEVKFNHNSGYVEFRTISPTSSLVNARITGSEVAIDPRCGMCF